MTRVFTLPPGHPAIGRPCARCSKILGADDRAVLVDDRLYHEISCPALTMTGRCKCTPIVVADGPSSVLVHEACGRWIRISPGAYDDGAGVLHIVVAEMLRAHGYPDTPAHRELVAAAARELFGAFTTIEVD